MKKKAIRTRICCEVDQSTHHIREEDIEILLKEKVGRGTINFLASPWLCVKEAEKAIEEVASFIRERNEQTPSQKIVMRQIPAADEPPTYPIGFIIRCTTL